MLRREPKDFLAAVLATEMSISTFVINKQQLLVAHRDGGAGRGSDVTIQCVKLMKVLLKAPVYSIS